MSEDQFNTLMDRVYQLEQTHLKHNIQRRASFIIQFFLLLVVILAIGYYFYQNLEKQIEEVSLTQSLLASKIGKKQLDATITDRIVDQIQNNELVRNAVKKVIQADLQKQIQKTALTLENAEAPPNQGEETPPKTDASVIEEVDNTVTENEDASEADTDDEGEKETNSTQTPKDYQSAAKYEMQGFSFLLTGEFDQAIAAFNKAERSYPSYHLVYEIGKLLQQEKENLNNFQKRREIFQRIANEMNYGAPTEMIEKLRKLANQEGITIKTDG